MFGRTCEISDASIRAIVLSHRIIQLHPSKCPTGKLCGSKEPQNSCLEQQYIINGIVATETATTKQKQPPNYILLNKQKQDSSYYISTIATIFQQ